jgi:hypothetical protein
VTALARRTGGLAELGAGEVVSELGTGSGTHDFERLLGLMAVGRLDGQVVREASWHEAGAEIAALLDRRVAGKAVLHVD